MSKSKKVAIAQYDGKTLLAKYVSISEASLNTGVQPAHIGKVANGIRNSAGGFFWKPMKTFNGKLSSKNTGVTQSDSDGIVAVYATSDVASDLTGVRLSDINSVLKGNRQSAGGYNWA